jgi:hypothetical protein
MDDDIDYQPQIVHGYSSPIDGLLYAEIFCEAMKRSYVEPAATPRPAETLAALIPLPERNNISPNSPPATAPTPAFTKPANQSAIINV